MKKQFSILLFLISFLIFSQNKILVSQINQQNVKADNFVGQDAFGYIYHIKNDVFCKTKDYEIFQYKNVSFGKITRVDIQNPLKIIMFYEDFNTVIILDNQLNEVQKINFNLLPQNIVVSSIGNTIQNNLWVFNANNQQIGLYNYLRNTVKFIANPVTKTIKFYQTNNNTFFWIDNENNAFSCDIFGKIATIGKIEDFDKMQFISNNEIIFKKDNLLYYLNLKVGIKKIIEINQKSIQDFYFKDQNLAIFTNEEITNYKITIP